MNRRSMLLASVVLVVAVTAACRARSGGGAPADSLRAFTSGAEFIFVGTTVLPRASTIDAEDVTNLAIVRVDSILVGAGTFSGLAGQQVTVQLRTTADTAVGAPRVYFTRGWHFGEGIGVIETGSLAAPAGTAVQAMGKEIERVRQEQSDADLRAELRSAERVVMGRVSAVRRADIPRLATEHDPDWQEADIEIAQALKGGAEPRTVTVLWVGSDDPMWRGAPRLAAGQEGIWLLRRFDAPGVRLERLTVTRSTDAWPRAAEERIRRLLQ